MAEMAHPQYDDLMPPLSSEGPDICFPFNDTCMHVKTPAGGFDGLAIIFGIKLDFVAHCFLFKNVAL